MMKPFHIVLVEPEIPQNTGNIARTCAATGTVLHLVRPLGFEITDKNLKRAGLDYWHLVTVCYHDSIEEVFEENPDGKFYFLTTKGQKRHSDVQFEEGAFLVFGKETKGLPETLLAKNYERCIRIPMIDGARSLNLANSVAIVCYEALRQHGFDGLNETGHLTEC